MTKRLVTVRGLGDGTERIWKWVVRSNGCWLWSRSTDEHGYGTLRWPTSRDKIRKVHRIAYELTQGAIPPGMQVLHRCDVPTCIRPSHLFLGTHTDNMRDMARKGRTNYGPAHAARWPR
jgi:hypothetical protein